MKKTLLLIPLLLFLCPGLSAQAQWVFTAGDSADDAMTGTVLDPSGGTISCGFFRGTVDLDPGPGVLSMTSSGMDMFVLRLDLSGQLLWAKTFPALTPASSAEPEDLVVDASGNIILSGFYTGIIDFDPGPASAPDTNECNCSMTDAFLVKLDPSGNLLWKITFGGNVVDEVRSVAVDATGNIYACGYFSGTVDFDPGPGQVVYTVAQTCDGFMMKVDPSGNLYWAKTFVTSNFMASAEELVLDESAGSLYIRGHFYNADLDPGPGTYIVSCTGGPAEVFLVKADTDGNFTWGFSIAGNSGDYGLGLGVSPAHDVLLSAFVPSVNVDLDPGSGNVMYSTSSSANSVLVCYDSSGAYRWHGTLSQGGPGILGGLFFRQNELYLFGSFYAGDLDPGPATLLLFGGQANAFISRLSPVDGALQGIQVFNAGGGQNAQAYDAAIDQYGNPVIAGGFTGTVDFDPGSGTNIFTSNGSYDAFLVRPTQTVGTGEPITPGSELLVFPNPGNGLFTVQLPDSPSEISMEIYDARGRTILTRTSAGGQQQLDLSGLAGGVYLLVVTQDDRRMTKKLVIQQ